MKVAVTGSSGFIGRHLCTALAAAGHQVVLDRTKPEAIVHLAGIAHRRASAEELQRVNVELAVAAAKASGNAQFIFISTVKVHGETSHRPVTEDSPLAPKDQYGESKARAEEALRKLSGLRLTILRPPLVYGPHVKANFLSLMNAIALGMPLPFASVRNRRSFIYVQNLADAIIACLGREGTFLVSDGEAISTPDLCHRIGAALRRRSRLFRWPPAMLPPKLANSLEVDTSAIERAVGWRPAFSMDQGIQFTADWYRSRSR